MQILVPIGTFEDEARSLSTKDGFNDMQEFLAKCPKAGRVIQGTHCPSREGQERQGSRDLLLSQLRQAYSIVVDTRESKPGKFDERTYRRS